MRLFRPFTTLAAAIVLLLSGIDSSKAQLLTPYFAQDGYSLVLAKAKDTLAPDAVLMGVATQGGIDIGPLLNLPVSIVLGFYQDSVKGGLLKPAVLPGQADVWIYLFNSATKGTSMPLAVVNAALLGGKKAMGIPISLPIPGGLVTPLDLTVSGTQSDSLSYRVKRDSTYRSYHARYPKHQPSLVSIATLPGAALPSGFAFTGPIWTLVYDPATDSVNHNDTAGLTCFVVANSGETICQEFPASPFGSVPTPATNANAALSVAPNPATGTTRISVTLPESMNVGKGVGIALYNVGGGKVLDLTQSLIDHSLQYAEFDSRALPAGEYFCRAYGSNWSGTAGVIITH